MINWKIRFKNTVWLTAFISQLLIITQLIAIGLNGAGVTDFVLTEEIKGWVLAVANAIFVALSMLGIVQDPTVEGIGDSQRSLLRKEPLKEELDER
ncbi:holin [Fictibacillus phosphorivorans]|uniref:Holin n=1 Tax=Fictibacillus phosphorivorans TaxID=1221500 RepID=A0A163Q879_9BACL|nr:phage holin [Fictibacillus phosphorivorans]KZE64695.1 holin [Fictibacillus phosphorivorans]